MTATTTESKPEDKTKAEKVAVGSAPSWTWGILVAICLILITIGLASNCNQKKAEEEARAKEAAAEYAATHPTPTPIATTQPPDDPEFPRSGSGYATKSAGVKCWLDPMKSNIRPVGPVRYAVADHPSLFVDDHLDRRNDRKWWRMPAGKYIIYPLKEGEEVYVRWW